MNEQTTYTLTQLAKTCGLTERTTRHYIEKILPPHHNQGRGKLARYGQDTLNSIRFIQLVKERHGFKPGQAKGVLASVDQETINRVVRGEEELVVKTVPSAPEKYAVQENASMPRASLRAKRHQKSEFPTVRSSGLSLEDKFAALEMSMPMSDAGPEINEKPDFSAEEPSEPWQTIFSDGQVRIQRRGGQKLSGHQEEQVEAAARLIELAIKGPGSIKDN